MNTYKAFCTGKHSIEIYDCPTSYEAQTRAARVWNMEPSQQHKISTVLCEKDGEQIIHFPLA